MISIVVPAYNEQDNIGPILSKIQEVMLLSGEKYEIILVNDGSTDETLARIQEFCKTLPELKYISLSRNFGHQNALKAGLDYARGEAVISMDADMQHPPDMILDFLKKWKEGFDVVYSIRKDSDSEGFLKNISSRSFYGIINSLSDIKIEPGSADFRLMDRKVLSVLSNLNENELFIRGLVPWIGFRQIGLDYVPDKRLSGNSKYTLAKMLRLGLQGITSFSIRPLYSATYLGIGFSVLSILTYVPYILISFYSGNAVSGWSSVLATVVFLGGLQLMILGIIGIYLGKLFMQSKNRPNYIVGETNIKNEIV